VTARPLAFSERVDWLRLARTEGVGPVTFQRLLRAYGSAATALEIAPDLARRAGRSGQLKPYARGAAEAELDALERHGARLIAACEPDFPPLLAQLEPPPPVIAALGDATLLQKPAIAMVGSRNASAAGLRMARDLATELGEAGYVVVSGMARGIDGAAHAAALQSGTIAVLAGGLDHIYPPEHDALYAQIAEQGALISESPLGYVAAARDFPRRNRLISGLSLGVVVVEAALQSGSLITARTALEQNREVMAVPGSPLDPRSRGGNDLLKQGAVLVENADDVVRAINALQLPGAREPASDWNGPPSSMAPAERALVEQVRALLSPTAVSLDELARLTGASAAEIAAAVVELELAGYALSAPGGRVAAA
jgi:DNA processing protein